MGKKETDEGFNVEKHDLFERYIRVKVLIDNIDL